MRGNQHGAAAKQLSITEKLAECRHAHIVKAAARLVEQEEIWGCRKRHNDRKAATLAIGESPRRCIN